MAKEKNTDTKAPVAPAAEAVSPASTGVKMLQVHNSTTRSFLVGEYVVRPGHSSLPEADARKLAADWPGQVSLGDGFQQTDLAAENAALKKKIEELEAKAALG